MPHQASWDQALAPGLSDGTLACRDGVHPKILRGYFQCHGGRDATDANVGSVLVERLPIRPEEPAAPHRWGNRQFLRVRQL